MKDSLTRFSFTRPPLLGDHYQLAGYAITWTSPSGLVLALVGIPFLEIIWRRPFPAQASLRRGSRRGRGQPRNASVWPGLPLYSCLVAIAIIPAVCMSIATGETPLFYGSPDAAVSLLNTLTQVEAAIGALLVALLLLALEVTSSAYSPRLSELLTQRRSLGLTLLVSICSVSANIIAVANSSRWSAALVVFHTSRMIDVLLLGTVATFLTFAVFARDAFSMLRPEAIVSQALQGYDDEWSSIVRSEWASRFGPHSLFISRDPLILVERILVAALTKGDIISYKTGLILLSERVEETSSTSDAASVDAYLEDRLLSVIETASKLKESSALVFLAEVFEECTTPPLDILKSAEPHPIDPPVGTRLIRRILETSLSAGLSEASFSATSILSRRATMAFQALPEYSQLGRAADLIVDEGTTQEERDERRRNDWRLDNFLRGYMAYMSDIAETAAARGLENTAWSAGETVASLIPSVLSSEREEEYQLYILRWALFHLNRIIDATTDQLNRPGSILSSLSSGLIGLESVEAALSIAELLCNSLDRLSDSGKLDWMTVNDITSCGFRLSTASPQAGVLLIVSLGKAAATLKPLSELPRHRGLSSVINHIHSSISFLEPLAARGSYEKQAHDAAQTARDQSS
jgi:uncharacterized protein YkvS